MGCAEILLRPCAEVALGAEVIPSAEVICAEGRSPRSYRFLNVCSRGALDCSMQSFVNDIVRSFAKNNNLSLIILYDYTHSFSCRIEFQNM